MNDAIQNPHKYSPVVPYSDEPADLNGNKIEVRWDVVDEDGSVYLHCFEGTVKAVMEWSRDTGIRKSNCKVALIEWDAEFNLPDGYIPLNPNKYDSETVHLGWNMLRTSYVEACSASPE